MFIAKFPLLFIVRAKPDLERGTLRFCSGYMAVRYQMIPGHIATPVALAPATPPWSIAEAPSRNNARIFVVTFDGDEMMRLVKGDANHPAFVELLDQRIIQLPVHVGAVPPEPGDTCGNQPLVVSLSLKLALEIS